MLRSRDLLSSFTTQLAHMLQPTNSPRSQHSPLPASSSFSAASSPQPSPPAAAASPIAAFGSTFALPHPALYGLASRYDDSAYPVPFDSFAASATSAQLSPARGQRPTPLFHSPLASRKRTSRSDSSLSLRHSDVASVTASANYSTLYSPPHNLYSHLYSHSSASSTSSTAASSLSFHPARNNASSSFLPAFTASIYASPESTSHNVSAPPSPLSTSMSRSHTLSLGMGKLATSSMLPAFRNLQPLEPFSAPPLRPLPTLLQPSPVHPASLLPQLAYPPSFMQVTEDADESATPSSDEQLDEADGELASLSSSSSFSVSRVLPSTPTLSRFRPARSPSIDAVHCAPVPRDDFARVELDPREPLPVWHPSLRSVYAL